MQESWTAHSCISTSHADPVTPCTPNQNQTCPERRMCVRSRSTLHGKSTHAMHGKRFSLLSSRSLPSRSRSRGCVAEAWSSRLRPRAQTDGGGAPARRGVRGREGAPRRLRGVAARAGRLRPRQRVHRRPFLRGRLQRRPLGLPHRAHRPRHVQPSVPAITPVCSSLLLLLVC